MDMDLGKSFNFSVGGGVQSGELFTYGAIICGVILIIGIINFIWLSKMKQRIKSEFSILNEKIDSITKTLKDVE